MTTVTLPADTGSRRYVGPADHKPAGTQVGATEFAIAHVLLVDASNNPLVVAVDLDSGAGTANRMGTAILVPASGGPAVVPGDATNGLKVQLPSGAAVELGATTLAALETVSIGTALPAGTNAVGKLAANSGVDIGDVDVTSLPYTAALTMTHTAATATTTTGAMLAANVSRKYALIQNIGTVDVFIKIAASAVASQGICLKANGGAYEMSPAFGNLATGAINGITASGSAAVIVTEGA